MKYYTAHCRDESSEDSLLLEQVRIQKEQIVFAVVCDGIGGLQQGEIASGLLA